MRESEWDQETSRSGRESKECADAAFLVWTPQINNQQRFSRAVPGTGDYCQAPARPGPPCSQTPLHYPSFKKKEEREGGKKERPSSQACSGAE